MIFSFAPFSTIGFGITLSLFSESDSTNSSMPRLCWIISGFIPSTRSSTKLKISGALM